MSNPRPRSRAAAKAAGTNLERETADSLAEHVSEFIDRRVKTGAKDKGDIANVRTVHGARVVVECKNVRTMSLGTWVAEAEEERKNDEALVGVVVHKRTGKASFLDQYVTMTGRDFIALLTGLRPE